MVTFTPTQWIILLLVLVLGWILGLMSRSGGGKWKRELAAERELHAESRRSYEARIAELERGRPVEDRGGAIDNLDLRRR